MSFRSSVVLNFFLVVLFMTSVNAVSSAQQVAKNQTPAMSAANGADVSRKLAVDQLDLKTYEVVNGDLSLCQNDMICVKEAKGIKSWRCAQEVCAGTDTSKKPMDCFEGLGGGYTKDVQAQIEASLCSLIKSPSTITRQALLGHMSNPEIKEDILVKRGAYLLALKGDAGSCGHYIKDFVGAYGAQWNSDWYLALSGCRILAGERTRQQEEKDFYTWFGVIKGIGSCADIENGEMREACSAPEAASPVPSPKPNGQ
ncbi:MAG: hypothetical protein HQL14_06925 [Candidatus Omnitrophica bacterium]|nr:hypothetical protein [Candidatus Omnitrophota bacterium]